MTLADSPRAPSEDDWRQRKRAATRQNLQLQAMRLFLENGFDATTVQQISAAAGVSHMTFFRYFPTKEDVVDIDDYGPRLADLIAARPPSEPAAWKVRHAIVESIASTTAADRDSMFVRMRLVLSVPSLRARAWEHQHADEMLIVQALDDANPGRSQLPLSTRTIAAASVAALNTAVRTWADTDAGSDLAELVEAAFDALFTAFGPIADQLGPGIGQPESTRDAEKTRAAQRRPKR